MSLRCSPLSLSSIRHTALKNFKMAALHGGNLEYRNGTILAILNLLESTMPPTKYQLNQSNNSGGDVEKVKS